MKVDNYSVRIVQVDGKDIYLTNYMLGKDGGIGYSATDKYGIVNTKRYRASLDYSLELIKLFEVYREVYGTNDFTFNILGFDYTKHVCSLTFKYAVKEYNRMASDVYIRHDASCKEFKFDDCVWVENQLHLLLADF